jgi:hypothetical protein
MPLPKGFVSGTLTCSCGAKIKTQRPAKATKHPCQCPKCLTTLAVATEQIGTVVRCSQCSTEFKPSTGTSENTFGALGPALIQATPKVFSPSPTTYPTTQTSHHHLIKAAKKEQQARDRETEKERISSSVALILGIVSVPLVLGAFLLVGYLLYSYMPQFSPTQAASDTNDPATKKEEKKYNPLIETFKWNGIGIGSTLSEVENANGYKDKIRYLHSFSKQDTDAKTVKSDGSIIINFRFWENPVNDIEQARIKIEEGRVSYMSLDYEGNYEKLRDWIIQELGGDKGEKTRGLKDDGGVYVVRSNYWKGVKTGISIHSENDYISIYLLGD